MSGIIKSKDDVTYNDLGNIMSSIINETFFEIFVNLNEIYHKKNTHIDTIRYTKEYYMNEYENGNYFVLEDNDFTAALLYKDKKWTVKGSNNINFDNSLKSLINDLRPSGVQNINKTPNIFQIPKEQQSISSNTYANINNSIQSSRANSSKNNELSSISMQNVKEVSQNEEELNRDSEILDYVVHFRPNSNYKGEFGFDWLRIGDTTFRGDRFVLDNQNAYMHRLANKSDYQSIKKQYDTLPSKFRYKSNNSDEIKEFKYAIPKMTLCVNTEVRLRLVEPKGLKEKEQFSKLKFETTNKQIKVGHKNNIFAIRIDKELRRNEYVIA